MERKQDGNAQDNAFSAEKIPVFFEEHVTCPILAFRALEQLDPAPDHHAANRISDNGDPPTAKWMCEYYRKAARRLFPKDAEFLDFTDHMFCIGANSAMQDLGIPHTLQCHAACKSLTTGTTELYRLRTLTQLCRVQRALTNSAHTAMAATFGISSTGQGVAGNIRRPTTAIQATQAANLSVGNLDVPDLPIVPNFDPSELDLNAPTWAYQQAADDTATSTEQGEATHEPEKRKRGRPRGSKNAKRATTASASTSASQTRGRQTHMSEFTAPRAPSPPPAAPQLTITGASTQHSNLLNMHAQSLQNVQSTQSQPKLASYCQNKVHWMGSTSATPGLMPGGARRTSAELCRFYTFGKRRNRSTCRRKRGHRCYNCGKHGVEGVRCKCGRAGALHQYIRGQRDS